MLKWVAAVSSCHTVGITVNPESITVFCHPRILSPAKASSNFLSSGLRVVRGCFFTRTRESKNFKINLTSLFNSASIEMRKQTLGRDSMGSRASLLPTWQSDGFYLSDVRLCSTPLARLATPVRVIH